MLNPRDQKQFEKDFKELMGNNGWYSFSFNVWYWYTSTFVKGSYTLAKNKRNCFNRGVRFFYRCLVLEHKQRFN
jgi:hypothetical protein